ncbi:MAG: DUF2281 domain-containing protein [Deltaproteobacteria bacterium]|nr:DUF2281 domain-containing protein [Deltaproteobacteria bacterium]
MENFQTKIEKLPPDIRREVDDFISFLLEKRGKVLAGEVDLSSKGWTTLQAAETRSRLESFGEDWNTPGMEAYDAL